MSVLIISSALDVHAQAVIEQLKHRAAPYHLLDLSLFPMHMRLVASYGRERGSMLIEYDDGTRLDLAEVDAVWWRRPQAFNLPAAVSSPDARRFAISEASTAFQGLYQSLDARWINPPAMDAMAGHKTYQLTLARALGFTIPETLVTNSPEAARAFWRQHPGNVVHKQFVALPETCRETRRIGPEAERQADSIAFAPVIFQENIEAVREIRVTIVGGKVFAAATELETLNAPQDVRSQPEAHYAEHHLPPEIAEKLLALCARLGLVYGAADLRQRPDGEYVFLEINPAGQFLYIELQTKQPIAATLAEALIARPRVSGRGEWAEALVYQAEHFP